jgi:hypothetical protein
LDLNEKPPLVELAFWILFETFHGELGAVRAAEQSPFASRTRANGHYILIG